VAGPGRIVIELMVADPLAPVIPTVAVPEHVDLDRIAVGVREDGQPWTIGVAGSHVLIAG
jgi:S-DNA-T family DNA segregation ATPase FtsK/SpoIIIE